MFPATARVDTHTRNARTRAGQVLLFLTTGWRRLSRMSCVMPTRRWRILLPRSWSSTKFGITATSALRRFREHQEHADSSRAV